MQTDVLIIGAGAAGLMAAKNLSAAGKSVVVLEARGHSGGRARTITDDSFSQSVETGAEFIHGNLQLTLQLLKEAGLKSVPAGGEAWRSKEGRLSQQDDLLEGSKELVTALKRQTTESSVADFLEANFSNKKHGDTETSSEVLKKSVQGYVEGYYAGDVRKASVLALKEEWLKDDEPQRRVAGGYTKLMDFLYNRCLAQGCVFHFSAPAKTVAWAFEKVEVTTSNGAVFSAKKLISTIPPPVLLHGETAPVFQPAVTTHLKAMQNLGFGDVIKILIECKAPFWQEDFKLNNLGFLFSDEAIPTWWTQHPQPSPLLVGWCAGPGATALKGQSDAQLFQTSMLSLARIFNRAVSEIEKTVVAWKVCNWAADPFSCGGYSYVATTTGAALRILSKPIGSTLYFAGEALHGGPDTGTVEAALQSGRQAAQQIIASVARS